MNSKAILFLFLAKRIFPESSYLAYFLHLLRIPMKNTFDTFFSHWIENKMDDVLNNEENIISVIRALQGRYLLMNITRLNRVFVFFSDAIFPTDVKDDK